MITNYVDEVYCKKCHEIDEGCGCYVITKTKQMTSDFIMNLKTLNAHLSDADFFRAGFMAAVKMLDDFHCQGDNGGDCNCADSQEASAEWLKEQVK